MTIMNDDPSRLAAQDQADAAFTAAQQAASDSWEEVYGAAPQMVRGLTPGGPDEHIYHEFTTWLAAGDAVECGHDPQAGTQSFWTPPAPVLCCSLCNITLQQRLDQLRAAFSAVCDVCRAGDGRPCSVRTLIIKGPVTDGNVPTATVMIIYLACRPCTAVPGG